nr:hypothetical protein [Tanacetum cinerariifolium]
QRSSGIDEGTGSKLGVPNVPSDDSEEELSWNSSDDEDVSGHKEGKKSDESDDDRDEGSDDDSEETVKAGAGKDDDDDDDEDDDDNEEEEELAKSDEEDKESGKGGDEVRESKGESDEEETRQEEDENFDPIPRTPEESEEESNDEEDQDLRLSEEARIQEEEDADELDVGVESIFTTTSSPIVSLETPTPVMTPSTIATITTSGEAPIPPPTIPSIILENLPTFNSAFRFEERLRLLETSFSEYRQINLFADAMSAILGIVHQYITQQMKEAIQEAVQIQTHQLQDSLQRENDEFLHNIDENMKKVLKGLVKNQVKEQVSPDLSEMELKKILIEKIEGNKSIQTLGGEHASASTPSEKATEGAGESTTGSQSRQMSASESAFAEEPVQTTCQMEETAHLVFETGADDQPIVQTSIDLARQTDARSSFNELLDTPIDLSNFIMHRLNIDTLTPDLLAGPTYELMRGSCTILTELEYHLEEVYKATTDQLDWVNLEGHKNYFVSDLLIDFQIKFSLSIGEIVTHWFTLIVLPALRHFGNENMLSLGILILRSILTDSQVTPTKPG